MKSFLGLIVLIGIDNNMSTRPLETITFPEDPALDWPELEKQAARLNLGEAEVFCCGEFSEARQITVKHDIFYLDTVLNRCFDGDLHDTFFVV